MTLPVAEWLRSMLLPDDCNGCASRTPRRPARPGSEQDTWGTDAWVHETPGCRQQCYATERLVHLEAVLARFVPSAMAWCPTHRHVKTGGEYRVLARGKIEATLAPIVVYENRDGETWVRPVAEFEDGRFVPLASPGGTP